MIVGFNGGKGGNEKGKWGSWCGSPSLEETLREYMNGSDGVHTL